MKKILIMLLAVVMLLSLVACNDKPETPDEGQGGNQANLEGKATFEYDIVTGDNAVITKFNGSYDDKKVEVPAEIDERRVVGIGAQAFYYNNAIEEVILPDTVKTIDNHAFAGCAFLKSITIPDSVTSIGAFAFTGCVSLSAIDLPASLKTIGDAAFHGCTALAELKLPDSLEEIGDIAFWGCTKLTSVEFPASVKTIGDQAFYECSALASVKLTKEIEKIGAIAFHKCAEGIAFDAPADSYAAKYIEENY